MAFASSLAEPGSALFRQPGEKRLYGGARCITCELQNAICRYRRVPNLVSKPFMRQKTADTASRIGRKILSMYLRAGTLGSANLGGEL